MIEIGKKGKIVAGDEEIRYVLVQDDRENTGGYLILKGLDVNFERGYDDWVEAAKLDDYFKESGWVIDWINN